MQPVTGGEPGKLSPSACGGLETTRRQRQLAFRTRRTFEAIIDHDVIRILWVLWSSTHMLALALLNKLEQCVRLMRTDVLYRSIL